MISEEYARAVERIAELETDLKIAKADMVAAGKMVDLRQRKVFIELRAALKVATDIGMCLHCRHQLRLHLEGGCMCGCKVLCDQTIRREVERQEKMNCVLRCTAIVAGTEYTWQSMIDLREALADLEKLDAK